MQLTSATESGQDHNPHRPRCASGDLFPSLGSFQPGISKPWKFRAGIFQALEVFSRESPSLGSLGPEFSKPWKFRAGIFQALDRSPLRRQGLSLPVIPPNCGAGGYGIRRPCGGNRVAFGRNPRSHRRDATAASRHSVKVAVLGCTIFTRPPGDRRLSSHGPRQPVCVTAGVSTSVIVEH